MKLPADQSTDGMTRTSAAMDDRMVCHSMGLTDRSPLSSRLDMVALQQMNSTLLNGPWSTITHHRLDSMQTALVEAMLQIRASSSISRGRLLKPSILNNATLTPTVSNLLQGPLCHARPRPMNRPLLRQETTPRRLGLGLTRVLHATVGSIALAISTITTVPMHMFQSLNQAS